MKKIKDRQQFKDAQHFTTTVSRHPKLSRRTKHKILKFLTHKPIIRLKNKIYNNASSLKIASKYDIPFNIPQAPMEQIKSYLSKTKKKSILAGKPSRKKRVHPRKKNRMLF